MGINRNGLPNKRTIYKMTCVKLLLFCLLFTSLCAISIGYDYVPYGWYQRRRGYWQTADESGRYSCVPTGTCPGNSVS